MRKAILSGVAMAAMLAFVGSAQAAEKKTLVFVVNAASAFWKAAEAGIKKAQGELPNYNLELKFPEQSSAAIQTRLMDDLVASGAAAELTAIDATGLRAPVVEARTVTIRAGLAAAEGRTGA